MLMTEAAPYELGPTFLFELEELHHLVWSNSIDGRDPDRPVWIGLDRAVAAGARPVAPGGAGDVVLPDGTVAWLDGGPVRHVDPVDGVPVVHMVAVEHGSMSVPSTNVSAADLAPDQLAAVTHPGGGARIIAPAGSGKTRVLTERARHLLTQWKLPPSAVSLVAFNKRAQEEMVERTRDLPGLQVRTLNAIALAIVNGRSPFAPQTAVVAHHRRTRRAAHHRRPRRLPAAAQQRSDRAVDRSAHGHPARTRRARGGRGTLRRRRRRSRRDLACVPQDARAARGRSTSTTRSIGRCSCCCATRPPAAPRNAPAG